MAEKDYGKFKRVEFLDLRDERWHAYRERIKAGRKARRLIAKINRKEQQSELKRAA